MTGTVILQPRSKLDPATILETCQQSHLSHKVKTFQEFFIKILPQPQSLKVVNNILGKSLMNSNFRNPKFSIIPRESFENYSKFLVTCYQITSVIFLEMKTQVNQEY